MRCRPPVAQSLVAPGVVIAHPELWCNGPPMHGYSMTLQSSLLGNDTKRTCWPRVLRVGIAFPKETDPFEHVSRLLQQAGYGSPEELQSELELPDRMLVCHDALGGKWPGVVDAFTAGPKRVLKQAIILGLCGANFYDPSRPVIWTNHSLTRILDLFDVGDFYASD